VADVFGKWIRHTPFWVPMLLPNPSSGGQKVEGEGRAEPQSGWNSEGGGEGGGVEEVEATRNFHTIQYIHTILHYSSIE
jgi:hypothetical protein